MAQDMCDNCGSRMRKEMISYTENYLGIDLTIDKVKGFKCTRCENKFVDPEAIEGVKQAMFQKKIEAMGELTETKIKPILINKVKSVRTREDVNIPQKSLGKAFNFTMQRYGAIERNINTPTIFTAMQIARLLNQDVNDLYELVYIPIEFYEKIDNMTRKAEEDMRGVKKKIDGANDELKDIQNQILTYKNNREKEKVQQYKRIKEQLTYKKKKLQNELDNLDESVILIQGFCVEEDKWNKVCSLFPQYTPINI
jgi:YgiT-type zinc finger domain-containing protein